MAKASPSLIHCAAGGPAFARAAVAAGWLYGARLPAWFDPSLPLFMADQDWKAPDRTAYMAALAKHRPALATVLDWEREEQLPLVLSWAEEAAQHVSEAVLIVPKVAGGIASLPRVIGGREVRLAYSVPTRYGGSPVPLWEHAGRAVHLLGGSPQEQLRLSRYACLDVRSADGNMAAQQSRRGRTWCPRRKQLVQLRDLGDERTEGLALECFRRSLEAVRLAWLAKSAENHAP